MGTTDMHFGASPDIFEKAKVLRNNMTLAENKLWEKLNKKQLPGFKFRRQHPIGTFIADFYCHALKLVIEIDGEYQEDEAQTDYDNGRTYEINKLGITVIRFKNAEIMTNINGVLNRISEMAQERQQQLPGITEVRERSPRSGEGGAPAIRSSAEQDLKRVLEKTELKKETDEQDKNNDILLEEIKELKLQNAFQANEIEQLKNQLKTR